MRIGYIGLLLLLTGIVLAQGKYDANWCFGVMAGVNFSNAAAPVNFSTLCNEDNAAASISDSFGNLLFYIAPDTPFQINSMQHTLNSIYNDSNQVIQNGDSIDVGVGLTGALFLPFPHIKNAYCALYMHRGSVNNLYGSIITKDGTGYTVTDKNKIISTLSLEWGIAAVRHANGNDWWVIAHEVAIDSPTNTFYEYLFTKDSIYGPYIQEIGNMHNINDSVIIAYLKFSKNGDWLASSLDEQNGTDLFNFDRCTGQLKNFIPLVNIDSFGYGQIADCEFSPDESKLYISEGGGDLGSKSALYQFDLTSTNIDSSKITIFRTDSAQTIFGDLRRAPDNKIYLAVEYSRYEPYGVYNKFNQYLWVINDPDSAGTACNFQPYGYFLGDSARVYWALPNMPNYNLGALSIYQGMGSDTTICNTQSVNIGNPPVANVTYAWLPAQGITDTTLAQQTVKPDTSTWYYVTLTDSTINYSCQSVTDSFFVQVVNCCDSALLSQCTLSKDTFICTDIDTPTKGAVLLVDTAPGISFAWRPAAGISVHSTQQIVNPSQSTWYYVTFFSDSDLSLACNKRLDSVYVKVEVCMGIEEVSAATQHLNIYPNPAQTTVTIEWQPIDERLQFSVTDLLGREASNFKVDGVRGKTELDISGLANGLYVVRLLSPSGRGEGEGSVKLTVIK